MPSIAQRRLLKQLDEGGYVVNVIDADDSDHYELVMRDSPNARVNRRTLRVLLGQRWVTKAGRGAQGQLRINDNGRRALRVR